MKRLSLLTAVLILVAMTAGAQVPKPFTIYADAGLTVPNGDFGDAYKAGFHLGAGMGFSLAPNFQVIPNIEFHSLGLDASDVDGGNMSVWMFGANGRMNLGAGPMPMKPFLLGGVGFAHGTVEAIKMLATEISPDASTTDFYWNFGAGLQFSALFVQARYVSIATEGSSTNYIPVTVGFKF